MYNPWEKVISILETTSWECRHNVLENNIVAFSGMWNDKKTVTNPGMQMASIHTIIRNNEFHSNVGDGLWIVNWGNCPNSKDHRIYNNVFYHNGYYNYSEIDTEDLYGMVFAQWSSNKIENNDT